VSEPVALVLKTARLDIAGDEYDAFRNAHPTYTAYRLKKTSGDRAGNEYLCREHKDGRQECNCKSYQCRKEPCRHLKALQQLGVFDAPKQLTRQAEPCLTAEPDLY
jgi:hypothetical protein